MKFSVALCTILTAGLCMIRASEVDELYHVEDQNALAEEDYFDSELNEVDELDLEDQDWEDDEDYFDSELSEVDELDLEDLNMEVDEANFSSDSRELRARPSKKPRCERIHRHPGEGGKCLRPADLLGESCDFILGYEYDGEDFCYNSYEYCCINCHHKKQTQNCLKIRGVPDGTKAWRKCCPGWLPITKPLDSGCNCCFPCEPNHRCRKKGGFCISNLEEEINFAYCIREGGKVYKRWCSGGKNCGCCVIPYHD